MLYPPGLWQLTAQDVQSEPFWAVQLAAPMALPLRRYLTPHGSPFVLLASSLFFGYSASLLAPCGTDKCLFVLELPLAH